MIDEVGQYVGENTDHLLNLQSLIEEIGSKCEGKVWVMCTGQEALDEIIKTRQDEFSRIQARFKTRLSLSSTSADEVIQKRLLSKTDEAQEELEKIYSANDSVLRNLLKFNKDDALLDVRGFETPQEFARDFPFVPYQFLLLQKVYTAIRKHGNAGKHQSSGERSMLSGFQEAAKSVQEQDEFALVPFYKFYDTVKTSLDGAINRVIDRCQNAADEDRGIKPQDVDVLKLLYLIRYVDTDIKSTLDSIVILMADNINMDKIQMREQVRESLDRLLSQNYIGRIGNTYNFLTDEEQDIAREIKDTSVDTAQIIERIGHLVFGDIYDKKKYRYMIYDFPYDQYVDGQANGSVTGGMKLQIYSIATDDTEKNELRLQTNSKGQAKSIAFPAISTGVYGYPKKEAAKVAVHTILNELKDMDSDFEVYLAAFDQETASLYNQEIFEQANRKHSHEELSSIVSVCDKWMEKFTDADISYVELVDHYLADDCNTFGFEMDCGHAFQEKYKDAFNNLRTLNRVLDRIDDIDLLGSAIYSKWRYFNHWAYDAAEILSQPSRGWFVAILSRMKYLANKELMDRKAEIVDDTK